MSINLEEFIPQLIEHGKSTLPNEACGLVIVFKGRQKYIPCRNLASGDDFFLDPEDQAKAEDLGEIIGVLHTHVNYTSRPSEADIVGCNASKVPWLIYSFLDQTHTVLNPERHRPPLVGRVWYHGVQDCYTLLQDYYAQELNITLRDYPRQLEWWYKGDNLYEENFAKEGFQVVTDNSLQKHDILLMYNGAPVLNHAGIYVGDDQFLHHVPNRLSSRDVYGGYWRGITRYAIRHESLR